MRRAKETAASLREVAGRMEDRERSKELFTFALRSESRPRLEAAVALAESEAEVIARPEQLDADPLLLNTAGGTIDLRTGKVRKHDHGDLITKLSPIEYETAAPCPRWHEFLAEVLDGDEELIGYVQRVAGYLLTGDTSEQVVLIAHGPGANGKSVLTEILLRALGEYGAVADSATFTASRGQGIPNDLARLRGARLVKVAETEEGASLARQLVKLVSGGDTLAARHLYREWFEYRPSFKLLLVTNHLPRIPAEDRATWRRIRVIPFGITIPHERQDRRLTEVLTAELPGILAWMVEGCLAWRREGLGLAPAVGSTTRNYRERNDSVAQFIAERCEVSPGAACAPGTLRRAYETFCRQERHEPVGDFKAAIEAHGFEQRRSKKGRWWQGLALSPL